MNRQTRRLQEKRIPKELTQVLSTIQGLEEFAKLAERLKPHLENIEQLANQLEIAKEAVQNAQAENTELRAILEEQRQTFLQLFAIGMDIPLGEVLSMEAKIQNERETNNADTTAQPETEATEEDPSTDTPGGLETALTESAPKG